MAVPECLALDRPAEHVVRVTLSRPAVANALNGQLLDELGDVVADLERDQQVRAWVLTGAPRPDGLPWFSAGVDLKEALAGPVHRRHDPAELVQRIDDLLVPSIAAIGGTCTTGALELVLACDLRVAGRSARLSDWHLKRTGLGLGAWGAAARMARLVGLDKAKELMLLSAEVDGEEAARIGLVHRVVDDDALETAALDMARTLASYPRKGVRVTLGYLQEQEDMTRRDAIAFADRAPEHFGVTLRPFEDAARRWSGEAGG
ncbi:MAG: 3-hydroxypropionyl-coenzyme dehydratase [Frankiales bacterium]|nr:3-hydroxypropionyl-coenzyme dehydratase [Frankiales bacterium]